jgi:hypothetical protein
VASSKAPKIRAEQNGAHEINKAGTKAPALYISPFLRSGGLGSRLKLKQSPRDFNLSALVLPQTRRTALPSGWGGGLLLLRGSFLDHH